MFKLRVKSLPNRKKIFVLTKL